MCLQAHAPELFACGIAKSGAYNRTLTPFGFQAEERTIWQAPEVYNAMSPFMQVSSLVPCTRTTCHPSCRSVVYTNAHRPRLVCSGGIRPQGL